MSKALPRVRRRVTTYGNGWSIQEDATPGDGFPTRRYFFKGKEASRHELDSKVAQQLAGLTLIEKDIRNVHHWLEALRSALIEMGAKEGDGASIMPRSEAIQPAIYQARALYLAIITTYGKLFTTAKGRRSTLGRSDVAQEHRATHDDIIHARNNFAAHSGKSALEVSRVAVAVAPGAAGPEVAMFTELQQATFPGLSDVDAMDKLLSQLAERVHERLTRCWEAAEREATERFAKRP